MDDDEVLTQGKAFKKFSLDTLLKQPAATAAAGGQEAEKVEQDRQELAKKSDPRPKPGDPYRPHAGFINRLMAPHVTIHFVDGECQPTGYAYSHLERVRMVPGKKTGLDLEVRFSGSVVTDVRIEGRNLDFIYDCMALHLMPWVWERPEGIYQDDDDATVITKITIKEIER